MIYISQIIDDKPPLIIGESPQRKKLSLGTVQFTSVLSILISALMKMEN